MTTATLRPNPSERKTLFFDDGTTVECYAFVDDDGVVVEWHPLAGSNPDAFEALIGGSASPESKLDAAGIKTTTADAFASNEQSRAEQAEAARAAAVEAGKAEAAKAAKAQAKVVAAAIAELKGIGLSDATIEVLGLTQKG